jgi:excisionase family DNA binding protein
MPSALIACVRYGSAAESQTVTEPWVSVEDVARHLGVAKDSVYRWIDHRELPAHRIGRLWKFKLSEVDAWVRAGGAGTDEEGPHKESAP